METGLDIVMSCFHLARNHIQREIFYGKRKLTNEKRLHTILT